MDDEEEGKVPNADGTIEVTLIYSPAPRTVCELRLRLASGASLADALAACKEVRREFPQLDWAAPAVWGRRAALTQRLVGGERIELCRPLAIDPKLARRERFARQGSRASGLFASKRRVNAESGG